MNLIDYLCKINITNPITIIRRKMAKSEYERIKSQIEQDVQLREFGGRIHISYRGIPLLDETCFKDNACDVVGKIRCTLAEFYGVK